MKHLWPFLENGTKDHKPWSLGLVEFGTQFRKAADALSTKDIVPYQMRQSGPSIDISKRSRSLDATTKRGRWRSVNTVRHLSQKQRLPAVIINSQQGIPDKFLDSRISLSQRVVRLAVSRRFPLLVCLPSASPLSHRLHQEFKDMEEVHTLTCAGCAFGTNLAQRLQVWSTGIDRLDLACLETRCSGARGFCSWSRKQHQSCIGNHLCSLPPSLPHAFAHVVGSNAHARLFYSYNPPALPRTSDATRMVAKVTDSVPTCERLGTGRVGSTSTRL